MSETTTTTTTTTTTGQVIDARGMACPGPLMSLIGAIRQSQVGALLEVWSTTRVRRPTSRPGSPRPATSWSRSRPRTATPAFVSARPGERRCPPRWWSSAAASGGR